MKKNSPHRKIDINVIFETIFTRPGIYLQEMRQTLYQNTGKLIRTSNICRTLKKIGCSRQKIRYRALQQNEALRLRYMAKMAIFDKKMFVWIDETGFDKRNIARKYAYSVRGVRPTTFCIRAGGKRYSAIAAMSTDGVEDAYIAAGNVNRIEFLRFVRKSLLPILLPFNGTNPKSIVVMDNLSVHHCQEIIDCISSAGALVRFLPPYSPDFTPIESVFSEVKQWAQANDLAFQSTQCPRVLIQMAFASVSVEHCCNFIRKCGYI